jgi:ribonuclease E
MDNSKNKMLIDSTHPEETRVVVLRNGRVEEFDWESAQRKLLRGNIYLAKVTRVEPSLQAAFVDYGGNRHGFLAFNEIHPDYYQIPMADRQALLREEAEVEEAKARAEAAADAALPETAEGDEDAAEPTEESEPRGRRRRDRGERRRERGERSEAGPPLTEVGADEAVAQSVAPDAASDQPPAGAGIETAHYSMPAEARSGDDVIRSEPIEPSATVTDAYPYVAEAPPSAAQDIESGPGEHDLISPANAVAESELHAPLDPAHGELRETADAGPADGHGEGIIEVVEPDAGAPTEVETVGSDDPGEELPDRPRRPARVYKIQEVIRRRQIILVQVVKEERGNKGAALTTYLSLAGRYTVLMPNTARGGGISRKIANPSDRKRLRKIVAELEVPQGMGLIVRTAGASRTKAEIKRDFEYLLRLWENVRDLTLRSTAPKLVYEEGDLIKRSIRDLNTKEIDEIVVAGEPAYSDARDFMQMLMPSHADNVIAYSEPEPLFTRYQIERQLNAMFSPFVTLRSGGYIVINQTEALVSIDVNSGKATREHNIEDTALKTNMEAAEEIARQLKLRDLAGLIVIDFIDMEEKRNNRAVERKLKEALRHDRARIQVGRISHFGLLEMSRQRLRPGVLEGSTSQCPHCQGTGIIRSTESVALAVLRAIEDRLMSDDRHNVAAQTTADVALYILNQKRHFLNDMEGRYGVTISITASDKVHGANFIVERGPVTEERQPSRRQEAVQMDWRHRGPDDGEAAEVIEEAEAEVLDAGRPEEAETELAAETADDGQRSRGRRRRRRGRGRNGAETGARVDPAAEQPYVEEWATGERPVADYVREAADADAGGVQEIDDADEPIETLGGEGGAEREGGPHHGRDRFGRDERGEGGEGRRGRRRGRRGGRRDRDGRDRPPQTRPGEGGPHVETAQSQIAQPDEWMRHEPTVGDLAAAELRERGGDAVIETQRLTVTFEQTVVGGSGPFVPPPLESAHAFAAPLPEMPSATVPVVVGNGEADAVSARVQASAIEPEAAPASEPLAAPGVTEPDPIVVVPPPAPATEPVAAKLIEMPPPAPTEPEPVRPRRSGWWQRR